VRDKRVGSKAFIRLRRAVAALRVVARTAGDVGEEVTWGERKVTGGSHSVFPRRQLRLRRRESLLTCGPRMIARGIGERER
jgi:hypothetical protein